MVRVLGVAALVAVLWCSAVTPAGAYDSGPHAELTEDAMRAEGFGTDAIGIAQVNNWFIDLYEQAGKNPFSGHGGFWKRFLSGAFTTEGWPDDLVDAAERSHFDSSTSTLFNSTGVANEWARLQRAVWGIAREARDRGDADQLLAILGMSLHQLQDFYTHTNWVEPEPNVPAGAPFLSGIEGPGWLARGQGSLPTWFDVPAGERARVTIYTANTEGHPRQHGGWRSDGNRNVTTAMNKDWPGRPFYLESASTAYFATRQWIRAVRSWVGDDGFWRRAQRRAARQAHLDRDLRGMTGIGVYSGHWQGQGEPLGGDRGPGGSLLDLRQAVKGYFQSTAGSLLGLTRGRTVYRARFEQLIRRMAAPDPPGEVGPVAPSTDLQRDTRLVRLQLLRYRGRGLGDPGPDEADVFLRARIAGQPYRSANIEGEDSFSFRRPNHPFTFLKAVPAAPSEREPVTSIEIEVRTGDVRYAGTDDDVFLRLGPDLRFNLDKRLYDDFERGDRDTYSVPIDAATRAGLRVGDLRFVQLEKARDGIAGGWRLGGVRLRVNGRVVLDEPRVDRWLEDDRRTWRSARFRPSDPRGPRIPVWMRLVEEDSLYGDDDHGDVNPFDRRRDVAVAYAPGPPLTVTSPGGSRLGGRLGDGDEATIVYRLDTIVPVLPTPPVVVQPPVVQPPVVPPPVIKPPAPKPDLVISALSFSEVTVKNQGAGAVGPFTVVVQGFAPLAFTGLAPGASETRQYNLSCENAGTTATADPLGQVDESDETNNALTVPPPIC
jgi:hypothetical protein